MGRCTTDGFNNRMIAVYVLLLIHIHTQLMMESGDGRGEGVRERDDSHPKVERGRTIRGGYIPRLGI